MQSEKLLLRNCNLFDPVAKRFALADILIADGVVESASALGDDGPPSKVIDAAGRLAIPGIIDMHTHLYHMGGSIGVKPDEHCLKRGVSFAVDAGSAGAKNFEEFHKSVIEKSKTKIKAFLNISSTGILENANELLDKKNIDCEMTLDVCHRFKESIVGMKVRLTESIAGDNALYALESALRVAERIGLPMMVHPNDSVLSLEDILARLRPGDIFTHCYHEGRTQIIDSTKKIRKRVWDARERGVLFDLGHGMGSMSFDIAKAALAQGFAPDVISTDLHSMNLKGPVYDLLKTVSKFISLGLSREEVFASVTEAPRRILKIEEDLGAVPFGGALSPGAPANVAILDSRLGPCDFADSYGGALRGDGEVRPWLTILDRDIAFAGADLQ